jgi:hypothetical protein
MRDGLLREALGVARAEWESRLPALRTSLGAVTGEIWLRTVAEGQATDVVQAALWTPERS